MKTTVKEFLDNLPFFKTQQSKKSRDKLWNILDADSNGFICISELEYAFKGTISKYSEDTIQSAIQRAVSNTKNSNMKDRPQGNNHLDRSEFRLFLFYFQQEMNYLNFFVELTGGHNISLTKKVLYDRTQDLRDWLSHPKVKIYDFNEMDKDKDGQVRIEDFATWVHLTEGKKFEREFQSLIETNFSAQKSSGYANGAHSRRASAMFL